MIEDIKTEAIQTVQTFFLERFEPSVFLCNSQAGRHGKSGAFAESLSWPAFIRI